ncbi:uncharacterized protein LOC122064999 [Macadamia integrifolia]|uniref:uncharacterized protein LOC122064999 n=1 Tax=Macadamia integrifolia TaxID=60698 RepID=UPI001C4E9361|nr:uncharacterized protein LOC122064999 [Macadamia integrifolia]
MAFRALNHWRSLYRSVMTRTTTPKRKSFATSTVDSGEAGREKTKGLKGDYVPVYVVLGLIGVSVSLGLYTVMHQLKHSPNVVVSKKKRESLPELGDMEDADKFVKKSFFRKVAHIQESDHREQSVPDPIRGDTFAHPGKAESLKNVGAEASRH